MNDSRDETLERLPTEKAIENQARQFKEMDL